MAIPELSRTFVLRHRGVAQLASASALGAEGRVFESHHPDGKEAGTTPAVFLRLD